MSKLNIGHVRGSVWYVGTAMTGKEESAFTSSGIEFAYKGDWYLNTDTGDVYTCTRSGTPSLAKWKYSGSANLPYSLGSYSDKNGESTSYGTILKRDGKEVSRAEIYKQNYNFSVDDTGHLVVTY